MKRRGGLLRGCLALVAAASVAASADGQGPAAVVPAFQPASGPADDYERLIERLQAAERRIGELEAVGPKVPDGDFGAASLPGAVRVGDGSLIVPTAFQPERLAPDDDSPTTDSLADELSKRLDDFHGEWKDFRKSQDAAKAAAQAKPTVKIGGRIQLDYFHFADDSPGIGFFEHPNAADPQFGTDPEDRIGFRRLWLEMQGEIPDLMLWRMQVDFSQPQNPAFRDVFVGFKLPGNNTLLIGNQKRPIGLDALNTSRHLILMERSLSNDAFNDAQRRIGAQMYGYTDDLLFNWRYGVFNLQDVSSTGQYLGDALQLGGYGRLASTPWYDESSGGRGYLHLGISGSANRPDGNAGPAVSNANAARFSTRPEVRTVSRFLDTGPIVGANAFEQVGLESALNVGAMQLQAEYLATSVQRGDAGRGLLFHGGYVQAAYFLTGEFMPWDRESGTIARPKPLENFFLVDRCSGGCGGGWGAWQVAARYDHLDLTDRDVRGGIEDNGTLGLNWYWNAYAKMQFNLVGGRITDHRPVGGFTGGDFLAAGTRIAIDF